MLRWALIGFMAVSLFCLGCDDDVANDDSENNSGAPRVFNPSQAGGGAFIPGQQSGGGAPTADVIADASSVGDAVEPSDTDVVSDSVSGDVVTRTGDADDNGDGIVEVDVEEEPIPYCDDKIPCTIETILSDEGKCEGGKFICGDCAGSGCNFDSDCTPFNDDNPCNGVLKCNSGHCVTDKESIITCDGTSENPNERIRCNPSNGLCEPEPLPDGSSCDDGNSCTKFDVMFGGFCVGTEICSSCEGIADGSECDDGNPCTVNTTCSGGRCLGNNVCECMFFQDCVGLDDDNACNGYMTCIAGACVVNPETVVHCQRACPKDTCYQGDCLEETGTCVGKLVPGCE